MSPTLQRQKLEAALEALRCAESNIRIAAVGEQFGPGAVATWMSEPEDGVAGALWKSWSECCAAVADLHKAIHRLASLSTDSHG